MPVPPSGQGTVEGFSMAPGELRPGDPLRFTTLAHADRLILGPYEAAEIDAVLDGIELPAGARALDVGCGKGDLLVRLARRGATGTGIDRNPSFIAAARALAGAAGVAHRLAFEVGDGRQAALPEGLDLAACIGATGALGGPANAPAALASVVRPGGTVLVGEAFWRVAPDAAWLDALGVGADEMLDLAGTLGRMTAAWLDLVGAWEATAESWEAYEDGYAAAIERWAAAHPDDPDREAFVARAAFMRASWNEWRRRAMGFVTVALRRREPRAPARREPRAPARREP